MQPTKILRRIAADLEKEVSRMPGADLNAGASAYLDDAKDLRMFAAEIDRYRAFFKGLSEITANFQPEKRRKMSACTSHFIALRMQQAGFPTPEPMPGQFWYDPNDLPEAGRTWADHKRSGRVYLRTEKYFATVNPDCIYAPTVAEILQELPGFSLKAADNGHGFYCYRLDPNTARWSLNAADACGLAWLSLHEKKETL